MTAPRLMVDLCLCGHQRGRHRANGRFGCNDCRCDRFEAAADRAQRERVLRAVVAVCERQAAAARTELEAIAAKASARKARDELAAIAVKAARLPPHPDRPPPRTPRPPRPRPERVPPLPQKGIDPMTVNDTNDRLLTPGEVAAVFRVDPKTVTRWAAAGRIGSIRTPGGHRRFRESAVRALLLVEEEQADR